jgi:hypothetical protein
MLLIKSYEKYGPFHTIGRENDIPVIQAYFDLYNRNERYKELSKSRLIKFTELDSRHTILEEIDEEDLTEIIAALLYKFVNNYAH